MADERREAGAMECWCLHGAVGMAADWRILAKQLASLKIGTRAVDLWRFLECQPMPIRDFGAALVADTAAEAARGNGRALLGYSMGGRLALHALLEKPHPWQAAVIVSSHPGLESAAEREARRVADAAWAAKALTGTWQNFLDEWNAQALLGTASIRDPAASASLAKRRGEIARSFVDWSLGAQLPLWQRLPEITIPVLWIAGEQDLKFRALAERAVAMLPQATLKVAPNAGHRVPWEAGPWLAREVASFLSRG
jgi:2-succinyl-6-hydroxy-2,4-cyclohexadiene-1-carboxylate synthase